MKKTRPLRYLSIRVRLMIIALNALGLGLAVAYAAALGLGAPRWPLAAFLLLLVGLDVLGFFLLMRPFWRFERMMALFAEGYTMHGIGGAEAITMSPASERMIVRIREEFDASNLLKLTKRQAQYRALQNQINPHFLYNTLESIRSEALIAGLESVADMTEALAVFFRYTISKVENLVSVEEELQNCETYFRIQQYRFGSRLELSVECDPEDRDVIYRCRLPKLTLQPILENSIIHGTEFKVGIGHLAVRLSRTDERLLISVSDDGVGMDEATLARLNERLGKSETLFRGDEGDHGGSVALVNVNNRIRLIFGEQYGLHIHSMQGYGTDVEIVMPIITSDREAMAGEGLK